jgi:hypothetical protein
LGGKVSKELNYRITLIEPMLGTVPKNPAVFSRYIANERTGEDEISNVPEGQESGYTGFFTDENGIFLWDYHIKGFLKEAGNVLKDFLGKKALRSKLDSYLFVFPRKIRLTKEPDGVLERPLRGMTAQGPRVSLAKSDFINPGISFNITIRILPHKDLDQDLIESLLDYGALKGLGQWRNASFGRFTWESIDGR